MLLALLRGAGERREGLATLGFLQVAPAKAEQGA
jgi:hypothetical protein